MAEQQAHRIVTAVIQHFRAEQRDQFSQAEWTPKAKLMMTKLILTQAETIGTDLEAFAKHAKRSTICPDDIKLFIRRNPHLIEQFNTFLQTIVTAKPKKAKVDEDLEPLPDAP